MKIKEVSERTDLTERAIRLYIENGLVAPSVNESYSGRRNIDFSQEDVDRLRSISVMRKAGFSISQIKLMQTEPEKSREVLRELIDSTNKRIETDSEIVSCLKPLLAVENLNPEQISQSLENPTVEEKLLPPEDSEPSALQKFICKLFFVLGIAGIVFALICGVLILRVEIRDLIGYLYPQYSLSGAMLYVWFIGSLSFAFGVMLLNRKSSLGTRKRERAKILVSLALICLYGCFAFFNFANALISLWGSHPESYVISRTYNSENYMILDVPEAREVLFEFLPEELPDVDGVKYRYYYKVIGVSHEPPFTEVSVEIPLDGESFREAVEHYKAFRPSDSVCEPYEETKGDWTIIYYREDYEHTPSNYTPIFAFNESEYKVRLMCHYGRERKKGATNAIVDFEYEW